MEEDHELTEEQKSQFMRDLVGKVREYFYEPQSRSDIRSDIDEQLQKVKKGEDSES